MATKIPKSLILDAPCKVNLYLHVFDQRQSGYHDLGSLVVFADLCDVINIKTSDSTSLKIDGPFALDLKNLIPQQNLAFRATKALTQIMGMDVSFDIQMTKNIPVAAGLGGGSADAAAVIRAAGQIFDISMAEQFKVAQTLGADVPACLMSRSLFMSGIGEKLLLAPDVPSAPMVLVCPPFKLSSSEVFNKFEQLSHAPPPPIKKVRNLHEFTELLNNFRNDLTVAAESLVPTIREIREVIVEQPGCLISRMSGSGPACFGIFQNNSDAKKAVKNISSKQPNWWIVESNIYVGDLVK